jgi:hypothetical protein
MDPLPHKRVQVCSAAGRTKKTTRATPRLEKTSVGEPLVAIPDSMIDVELTANE